MRESTRTGILVALVALLAVTGCASTGSNSTTRSDRNLLTRQEIAETNHLNALDLLRSKRPRWLRVRGKPSITQSPQLTVYVDQMRAGTVDVLRSIQPLEIEEIRYYNTRDAQARFGVGHVQGVIQVITRRS